MKTITIIIAVLLIFIGTLLLISALRSSGWDLSKLGTQNLVTNSYDITRDFSAISIETVTADVMIVPAEDGKCKVVCQEAEKARHSVDVRDGALTVKIHDEREWLDRAGIHFSNPRITVYLPKGTYSNLSVKATTGDVDIRSSLVFDNIEIALTTGDVTIKNVECTNLTATATTGDIDMKNVVANEKMTVERTTGDVKFDRCDGGEIFIKTTTGDVEGSLLSGKMFSISSTTGDVSVPPSTLGGKCEITVTTGDVSISVK